MYGLSKVVVSVVNNKFGGNEHVHNIRKRLERVSLFGLSREGPSGPF